METKHRYNDQFENVTPEEYSQLSDQDKAELYRDCMLELEPYD